MKRLLLLLLLLAGTAGADPFSPPDHSFSVVFPGPAEAQQNGPPTWLWSWNAGKSPVYLLGYYQVPPDEEKQGPEYFDAYVNLMCNTYGMTEEKRTPFKAQGTFGYDLDGTNKRGRPTHIHILHRMPQHRFYFLMTVGEADYQTYFKSLKL